MKINKFFCVIICFAILISLCSCNNSHSEAEEAFAEVMEALKSGNKERIDEVYSYTEISSFVEEESGAELTEAVISTLPKMEYKILSSEKTGKNAVTINVEIKTVDFSAVVEKYIENLILLVDSNDYKSKISAMTDEQYKKILSDLMIDSIESSNDAFKTQNLDVTMTNSNGRWKLGGDSDYIFRVLFSGLGEAVDALS